MQDKSKMCCLYTKRLLITKEIIMASFIDWLVFKNYADIEEHATMKKINWTQSKSGGTRTGEGDLSGDYVTHISNMGTVEPFKLVKGKKKGKK